MSLLTRLTLRDMRGNLRHFHLFILAIFLGVLAIASVGFLSDSLVGGLKKDAKRLLGGDASIRLNLRQLTVEERDWMVQSGEVSRVAKFRSMARHESSRRLVEVKAIDNLYPLVGQLELSEKSGDLTFLDGSWGAYADTSLKKQLSIQAGDMVRVGDAQFQIRGWIEREPDRSLSGFELGPRLMISIDALQESGFEKPGSLIKNDYRILLRQDQNLDSWLTDLGKKFPEAGWRIRAVNDATPGIGRTLDRLTQFLTLIGLTTLLVCAVGSANAVKAYLGKKLETQAIFKTLGAGQNLLFLCFFLQIFIMAVLASALAIIVGYIGSIFAAAPLSALLNVEAASLSPWSVVVLSLSFGVLVAITFSFVALARVPSVPVARLFRGGGENFGSSGWFGYLGTALLAAVLIGLILISSFELWLSVYFLIAAGAGLLLLWCLAAALVWLVKRLPNSRFLAVRMALGNLTRPGSPTTATIISLGLGLTLLVTIAQTDYNLRRQVTQEMPGKTPAFYMIDIQKDDAEPLQQLVNSMPEASEFEMVPLLRGAIKKLKSVPVSELKIPDEIDWIFREDRGLTWMRKPLEAMDIVKGDWWPADYSGKPLVSLDEEVAVLMDLEIGDSMTINILGRDIEVEIANLRRIEWQSFAINFVVVFSPGLLEKAPQSYLATLVTSAEHEDQVESTIVESFPTLSSIRVRQTLQEISQILATVANFLSLASLLTLVAAVIVIAGAMITSRQKRAEEMVIFKVLGATKAQVLKAFIVEYGLMGLLSAVVAAGLGLTASYLVIVEIMDGTFQIDFFSLVGVLILGSLLTIAIGFIGTFNSLRVKSAQFLRND